jgi:hypothetical protein
MLTQLCRRWGRTEPRPILPRQLVWELERPVVRPPFDRPSRHSATYPESSRAPVLVDSASSTLPIPRPSSSAATGRRRSRKPPGLSSKPEGPAPWWRGPDPLLAGGAQPGRVGGSRGGDRNASSTATAVFGLLARSWSSSQPGRATYGVKVFPVVMESTKGAVAPSSWPGAAATPAGFAAAPAPTLETCSGMGWTNARHTMAMIVATVAQALTKDRLIRRSETASTVPAVRRRRKGST